MKSTRIHLQKFNIKSRVRKNAKMKKYDTLKKTLENIDNDTLKAIIQNDDIIIDALSKNEKMSVLVFNELQKALNNKKYQVIMNCNYANTKKSVYDMTYYNIAIQNRMIQIYYKAQKNAFDICTSCAKCYREQFEKLDELQFHIKLDKNNRAKTTERKTIAYDDIVSVIKSLIAILEIITTDTETDTEE